MKAQTILLSTLAVAATTLFILYSQQQDSKKYQKEFAQYRLDYEKFYASASESEYRYQVFAQNYQKVLDHPKDSSYTLGLNQFSDLTFDEFKRGYLMEELEVTPASVETTSNYQFKEIDWSKNVHSVKD